MRGYVYVFDLDGLYYGNLTFRLYISHCLRVFPPFCIYLVVDFSPAAFSGVPFFLASFVPVSIPLIDFLFDTSTLTSFLPFIFPAVTSTYLMSYCHILIFYSHFLPVISLHVMLSVVLSTFVFPFNYPLLLLSSSLLSPHCSFWPVSLSSLSIPSVSSVILISNPLHLRR